MHEANDKDKKNEVHREKLPAEVKFDKAVYGGISYFAQAGTGILLTHWMRHSSGRPIFDKIAQKVGPAFIEKVTAKRGAAAVKEADHWIVVSTMIMVGNTFLLPVKWLENRKPEIVRGMTERSNNKREKWGETIAPEELAHQQELLAQLDKEPKQTWWSLAGGRAFGLAAVYATVWGVGQKNNEALERLTASAGKEMAEAVGAKELAKSKTMENYLRIGFIDMFYSTVSAGGLYVYSHFIRPPKKEKINGAVETERQVVRPLEEAVIEAVDPNINTNRPRPYVHSRSHPSTHVEEIKAVTQPEMQREARA